MAESSPYMETILPYPDLNPNPAPLQPYPMRPRRGGGKSCTHFLFKALFVAIVIIVLPLFPSQAPEFINESIITKFWELLHLLFIGIAVSYGLFSRRNVEMGIEIETQSSKIENLQYDMSRMFHVSSVFEDGYGENPYGSDEKRVIQSRNGQYHDRVGESRTLFSSGDTAADEQCNPNLSVSESGVENCCDYGEYNVVQAWNSQYFQGESMVVVAQPNYGLGEWGETRSSVDYKPLGLPVRSLKSKVRKREVPELVNDYESGSGSRGSSSESSSVKGRNDNFGELGPQNLEHKFNEAVASPSPIPWRSRSGRMVMREKLSSISRPSHFRPPPVDETQFEFLRKHRTPSLRSTASFSSQASSISSSPGNRSPSHSVSSEGISSKMEDEDSKNKSFQRSFASSYSLSPPKPRKPDVRKAKSYRGISGSDSPSPPKPMNEEASEVINSKMEDEGSKTKGFQGSPSSGLPSPPKPMKQDVRKAKSYQGFAASDSPSPPKPMKQDVRKGKSYQGFSASDSPSPPKPMNDKASFSGFHTRGCNLGSLYESDMRGPKNHLKELTESRRDVLLSSKESEPSSLKLKMKAGSPSKASLKGKSVRTIRSHGLTIKANDNGDKAEEVYADVETAYMRKETERNESVDSLVGGSSKPNLDNPCAMTKHTLPDCQKSEEEEISENVSAGYKEKAENDAEKFQLNSSEDADAESVNDATPDSDEVDKKAGEFIAKFREQIRLQKVASIERSRGLRLGGNYFR
ncbi:hypothetical protein PanWU01x14_150090 [Parasponia andersonii]|uniref:Hydroxyproline-rich glycoprotein family protein n=1 Tax=Parasponia andersonii TaxID=3476 RepID=A0A2P5CIL4_PARAD|nr:hypothetical protein PanWU01x14_150090 [Parasponia andersonii]